MKTPPKTIDDVIHILEKIILESEKNHDPLGYFAVLYQKVTLKVKAGIENNFFDDGARMEQLDIVFAERYLKAYFAYRNNEPLTDSWRQAFEISSFYGPTVVQHLLVGINAHINLDLGIAAAEISKNGNIDDLKDDFEKINRILSSLVTEVREGLSGIWPYFRWFFQITSTINNLFVDLVIQTAREQAWKFALDLVGKPQFEWERMIAERDRQTARKAHFIGRPWAVFSLVAWMARIWEKGSVSDKIKGLKIQTPKNNFAWELLTETIRP